MTPDEEIEREITDILKPQGGRFGTGAPPPPVFQERPLVHVVTQPETPPEESPPVPLHDLLGLVIMTINDRMTDMEKMLDQRLTEIERVLGVKR